MLAYVSIKHSFSLDGDGHERHSGSWHALHLVNLGDGSETGVVTEQTIRLPADCRPGWICEIVAFGESGLLVKAALSKKEGACEYFVAELDEAWSLRPVAGLPAVFM